MLENRTKILLVEDSIAVQDTIKLAIVNQLNLEVVSARTITETRRILQNSREEFFVAILDLNLPDAPDGKIVDLVLVSGIPPIVLTSAGDDITREYMMKKPIIDYIIKRRFHEIQYLVDTIKRLLGNMSRKVLVVDDSSTSRALIHSLLERHYLTVLEASDGVEALKILEENKDISLIITDYNMPNMDGEEFIVKIRETHSRNELSIISISASDESGVSVKLLKSGANDFITKPFSHEEFFCRINQNIDAVISFQSLKQAATSDFLTGLFNRKYIYESAVKIFENAKREKLPISVAMLDIDFFKRINDTHGHQVGDLALKYIAQSIGRQIRSSDILARYGGEEFCLVCINHDESGAQILMERIRSFIQDNPLDYNGIKIPITLSIGYSNMLKDTFEEMIKDADKALYDAKKTGRNRSVQYQG